MFDSRQFFVVQSIFFDLCCFWQSLLVSSRLVVATILDLFPTQGREPRSDSVTQGRVGFDRGCFEVIPK